MKITAVSRSAVLTASLSLMMLLSSFAAALGGLSAGITAGSSGGGQAGLNVRGTYPLIDLGTADEPVSLALRADAAFSLSRLTVPALGAALVLQVEPVGRLGAYLGGGAGVTFGEGTLASAYMFTGIRYQLTGGLHAVLEGGANLNAYGTFTSLGLGLEYTFGARQ